jgi:hypothetical protein
MSSIADRVESKRVKLEKIIRNSNETYEQYEKRLAMHRREFAKQQGWICPLSNEPLVDACIFFGDGNTYNQVPLRAWLVKHQAVNLAYGPTGLPLLTHSFHVNAHILHQIRNEVVDPVCPLTLESLVSNDVTPVKLVRLTTKPIDITICSSELSDLGTCDASSFVQGLESTWSQNRIALSSAFLGSNAAREVFGRTSLSDSFVLVRDLLWTQSKNSGSGFTMFILPERPIAMAIPEFDTTKAATCHFEKHFLALDGDTDFVAQLSKRYPAHIDQSYGMQVSVFNGVFDSAYVCVHLKQVTFVNVLFRDCVFHHVCWCSVSFAI